jgi:hypothetical protein
MILKFKISAISNKQKSITSLFNYLGVMWRSPEDRNPPKLDLKLLIIRMVEEHYFEIVTTVRFS